MASLRELVQTLLPGATPAVRIACSRLVADALSVLFALC